MAWLANALWGEGVEGTLEGMQTARLLGTHRVGTISLPNHQFLNPSFYRSGHTLSSRFLAGRWACLYHIGQPLSRACSLHYTFPTPLALTFKASLGADRVDKYAYSRGVVYESGTCTLLGEGDENAYSSAENPLLGTPWGIVMLFKRIRRKVVVLNLSSVTPTPRQERGKKKTGRGGGLLTFLSSCSRANVFLV